MLKWFRLTVLASGLGAVGPGFVVLFIALVSAFTAWVSFSAIPAPAFALSLGVIVIAFCLEALTLMAKTRRWQVASVWPEVLDSLISASSSGMSMHESFIQLADTGPVVLRPHFRNLQFDLDSGSGLNQALHKLKIDLGQVNVDRLVELCRIVSAAGGEGFYAALRIQVTLVRDELALQGELDSKQGWVAGTAKVAIAAPWLIVAMLCTRPENIAAYANPQGTLILTFGLVMSIFAYRLIQLLGSTSKPPRVFAQ
jgi:tight adherence protein B